MIELKEIRENLQQAIRQSGVTQIEIARRLNVHHSMIGQYLSGRALPALDTFANLCIILDLDANEILGIK